MSEWQRRMDSQVAEEAQVRALTGAEAMIPPDWLPTPAAINALPMPLRRYIHDIETICGHAGMVQDLAALRDQVAQLSLMLEHARATMTNTTPGRTNDPGPCTGQTPRRPDAPES